MKGRNRCREAIARFNNRGFPPLLRQGCFLVLLLMIGSQGWAHSLAEDFRNPPASARLWAYWFFMDGNLSREDMTADLEAMQQAGIGGVIVMEVDVGVPRGSVRCRTIVP